MIIYIASPYSKGDQLANVKRQIDACEALTSKGHVPVWPLSSHYWHEIYPHSWDFWMQIDFALLERTDALLRLDGESVGADLEVQKAKDLGIPVYFNIEDVPGT